MTKQGIVKIIATKTGLDASDVIAVVEGFMTTVKDNVRDRKKVELRGFGTFKTIHRKQKVARNISAGTRCIVPAREVLSFKPSKYFTINQPQ